MSLVWTDPQLTLPPDEALCFTGRAELKMLGVGTEICRMRTNRNAGRGMGLLIRDRRDEGSPWWFPRTTLREILRHSSKGGSAIVNAARAGLAVPPRFNPDFDTLIVCTLNRSGFCWAGPAAPQSLSEGGPELLPGGLDQWWIPGLEEKDVRFRFFGNMLDRV